MTLAIHVANLSKTFGKKRNAGRKALDDVSFHVRPGEMVALIGASGSGKSTLLRHIAGLVAADREGGRSHIAVEGQCCQERGRIDSDIRAMRSRIGFVFQQFNLVDRLSVLTNVLTGVLGQSPSWRTSLLWFTQDEKRRAMESLARVGIADCALQRASTLSGGQQQRAAIARTLVQGARLVLADEPIASLDPASSKLVMDHLGRINREDGVTVLVSLHQVDYAIKYCPRTIALRDGKVVYDGPSEALTPELLNELYGAASEELLRGTSIPEDEPAMPAAPKRPAMTPEAIPA
jgi:phosphonate transport system ATP-binding protein